MRPSAVTRIASLASWQLPTWRRRRSQNQNSLARFDGGKSPTATQDQSTPWAEKLPWRRYVLHQTPRVRGGRGRKLVAGDVEVEAEVAVGLVASRARCRYPGPSDHRWGAGWRSRGAPRDKGGHGRRRPASAYWRSKPTPNPLCSGTSAEMQHHAMLGCSHAGKIIPGDRTAGGIKCPNDAPDGTNSATPANPSRAKVSCFEHALSRSMPNICPTPTPLLTWPSVPTNTSSLFG